jgi:hypothetical protein
LEALYGTHLHLGWIQAPPFEKGGWGGFIGGGIRGKSPFFKGGLLTASVSAEDECQSGYGMNREAGTAVGCRLFHRFG